MHARSNDATFKPVGQNWGQVKRYVRHRRKGAFWLGVFVTSPHRRRQLRSMTAPAAALRAVHLFCRALKLYRSCPVSWSSWRREFRRS